MQGLIVIARKKNGLEGLALNSGTWAPGMRLDRKRSYSYVSTREHTISIRQHTSAHISMRLHATLLQLLPLSPAYIRVRLVALCR
jgi:hypothetical protein